MYNSRSNNIYTTVRNLEVRKEPNGPRAYFNLSLISIANTCMILVHTRCRMSTFCKKVGGAVKGVWDIESGKE